MAKIKAKLSAIEEFNNVTTRSYIKVYQQALELIPVIERAYLAICTEYEKISRQVLKMQSEVEKIVHRTQSYWNSMRAAEDEAEHQERLMQSILDNPIPVSTIDDEGNEHTEYEIDHNSYNAAENSYKEAKASADTYEGKYNDAKDVESKAKNILAILESLKAYIRNESENVSECLMRTRYVINVLKTETDYNLAALSAVIESINYYLSSKSIFMPIGTSYEEVAVNLDSYSSAKDDFSVNKDRGIKDIFSKLFVKKESADDGFSGVKLSRFVPLKKTKYTEFQEVIINGEKKEAYNTPFESAKKLIQKQGNSYIIYKGEKIDVYGDCGICCVANLLNLANIKNLKSDKNGNIDERAILSVVGELINKNEILKNHISLQETDADDRGGTTPNDRQYILQQCGIESELMHIIPSSPLTINRLKEVVCEGKGVIVSVHAGILWNDVRYDPAHDYHAITLLSVSKDGKDFIYADTGKGVVSSISARDLQWALTGVAANVTTGVIR